MNYFPVGSEAWMSISDHASAFIWLIFNQEIFFFNPLLSCKNICKWVAARVLMNGRLWYGKKGMWFTVNFLFFYKKKCNSHTGNEI